MASLTETAIVSRKAIKYTVLLIIIIVVARLAFKGGVSVYKRLFPPKPTVSFGKLPSIPFPPKNQPENLSYSLETTSGRLPEFPQQVEVYFMPPTATNIQALEQAKHKASALGFSSEGKLIIENVQNVYLFPKARTPSNLTMNIITGIFSINYDLRSNPRITEGVPPSPESLEKKAMSLLSKAGYLDTDLKESIVTRKLLKAEGENFVSVSSLSESNLVKINLFRKNLGSKKDIPSVTPDMPEANVWFLFAGSKGEIIAAEYHHYPRDEKQSSTYPLKTAELAWQELNSGKAYIANLGENKSEKIAIRNVHLAYFDAGLYTEYFQPVVVFQGDNDFYAFVPAVTEEYLAKK